MRSNLTIFFFPFRFLIAVGMVGVGDVGEVSSLDCCSGTGDLEAWGFPKRPFDSATLIINNELNCIISFRRTTAR
ncbi:GSCOCG00007043001-RA-CDS [Cotesia congregata]|nr:GSCOCG00007043001-RA-CDS [Cotesia congregata]